MRNSLPSPKQKALLDFIGNFIKRENYAPSYREVMRALDYKSVSTVAKHIDGLIERGWLVKRDNSARSVEVLYREEGAEAENPPAPTLPDSHEDWLRARVQALIDDQAEPLSVNDREALAEASGCSDSDRLTNPLRSEYNYPCIPR